MKLVVTGGNGFIGSNLLSYWLNRYDDKILNIDCLTYAAQHLGEEISRHPNYASQVVNITSSARLYKCLNAFEPDGIIHLAAESHVDNSILKSREFINTNIVGTHTLLEYVRENKHIRFLHVSTDEVFGDLEKYDPPFTEMSPYKPSSPYSASKASADHLVRAYHRTYGLDLLITNCSNNYGPSQHKEKLIPTIIHNALTGNPIPIYGTGHNIRDWLYVDDHCRALDLVFREGTRGETYCIGGSTEKTNLELTEIICRKIDKIKNCEESCLDLITFVKDRAGHDKRYAIDSFKITNALGWKPKTDLDSGLDYTIDWYYKKIL